MIYFLSDLRRAEGRGAEGRGAEGRGTEGRADTNVELHYFPCEANLDVIRTLRVMGTSSDWDPKMSLQGMKELLEVKNYGTTRRQLMTAVMIPGDISTEINIFSDWLVFSCFSFQIPLFIYFTVDGTEVQHSGKMPSLQKNVSSLRLEIAPRSLWAHSRVWNSHLSRFDF